MSETEIDRLITMLEFKPAESIDKLVAIGEPALVRLLQALQGRVTIPSQVDAIGAYEHRVLALARLASKWPYVVISLIEKGNVRMTTGVIDALRSSTDPQLKDIGNQALKAGDF
jgi:hypothetical protein